MKEPHLEEIAHAQEQLDLLEGLGDEIARAGLERGSLALARHVGREDEHRQVGVGPLLFELAEHLDPVEVGHSQIQQDQIGLELGAVSEDLSRVGRAPEIGVAGVREQLFQEAHHGPLVVDDQNSGVAKRLRRHHVSSKLTRDLRSTVSGLPCDAASIVDARHPANVRRGPVKIWKSRRIGPTPRRAGRGRAGAREAEPSRRRDSAKQESDSGAERRESPT